MNKTIIGLFGVIIISSCSLLWFSFFSTSPLVTFQTIQEAPQEVKIIKVPVVEVPIEKRQKPEFHDRTMNRWVNDCISVGGWPFMIKQYDIGERWECFIEDEMVMVQGYEAYKSGENYE